LKIEKILDQSYNFLTKEEQSSLLDLYKIYESYFMKSMGGQLFPHVKEVLADLAKLHPVFIVSNCLSGYIENFIEFHHLQNIFSDFESSGNTGLSKAENIKLIIARNKLISPVYVGDTAWDQEASEINKLPFIYAGYGFGKANNPIYRIDDFKELKTLLF